MRDAHKIKIHKQLYEKDSLRICLHQIDANPLQARTPLIYINLSEREQ